MQCWQPDAAAATKLSLHSRGLLLFASLLPDRAAIDAQHSAHPCLLSPGMPLALPFDSKRGPDSPRALRSRLANGPLMCARSACDYLPGAHLKRPPIAIMVCGTTSGAGKSFLTTALARFYARDGRKVMPFKAQNMSNNARVVAGGEIGSAQYFQALAARCTPEVRMNPVLLKPERDTYSQVVVLGERNDTLAQMQWRERAHALWPIVHGCLQELRASCEVLLIEGAGSPAEINLQSSDIVNMRIAEAASARTLIICDIDRGGAFAHLYGTHQLLPPQQQALLRGFVLNKFRGDARLLAPAPQRLQSLTGVPTLGVLPWWRDHGLPEEDGVFDAAPSGSGLAIAIVAYPRISNLDEFAALRRIPGVQLQWARTAHTVAHADMLILPGSKHVAEDLAWLRQTDIAQAIRAHVQQGKPTLAVCGGLQMLGAQVSDPHALEGAASGLGLLPVSTEFTQPKQYRHGQYQFQALQGFWKPLSHLSFTGYEIHHGRTQIAAHATGGALPEVALADDRGWQSGAILALYTHGLFESGAVLQALFGHVVPTLDDTFESLADFVGEHLGRETLLSLLD
jgi:adenosylcobyric acid synthase